MYRRKTRSPLIPQGVPVHDQHPETLQPCLSAWHPALPSFYLLLPQPPHPLALQFLGVGSTVGCWCVGYFCPSELDRHQITPVQKSCTGVSPAERQESLVQAQCALMSLNRFWRKLVACQHRVWVESCTSRYQRLLPWVCFTEVHVSVGRARKMDSFLISCPLFPQTTIPWSLQIYHS